MLKSSECEIGLDKVSNFRKILKLTTLLHYYLTFYHWFLRSENVSHSTEMYVGYLLSGFHPGFTTRNKCPNFPRHHFVVAFLIHKGMVCFRVFSAADPPQAP